MQNQQPYVVPVADYRRVSPKAQQALLCYQPWQGECQPPRMMVTAWRTFLPLGLWLWGTTSETRVIDVRIGNQYGQFESPVPGSFFEQRRSMEELERLARCGELGDAARLEEFRPMPVLEKQVMSQLHFEGPLKGAALFGLEYEYGVGPSTDVRIGRVKGRNDLFEGQIILQTLAGERAVFTASASDEDKVVRLITAELTARAEKKPIY